MYSAKTNHQFQEAGETSDKSPQGYLFDRSLVFFISFIKVSGNKAGKKDDFKPAKDHLLWAIGGNISNPKCGPASKSSAKYNR